MKRIIPYVAVIALAAAAVGGCDRSKTAYNNSGNSATPGSTSTVTTTTTPAPTTSTTTSDTSSPNTATTAATTIATPATGPNLATDTVTTGKVKAAFASDSGLKDTDIIVKTDGGVVVLSGTVKSQDQITIAT